MFPDFRIKEEVNESLCCSPATTSQWKRSVFISCIRTDVIFTPGTLISISKMILTAHFFIFIPFRCVKKIQLRKREKASSLESELSESSRYSAGSHFLRKQLVYCRLAFPFLQASRDPQHHLLLFTVHLAAAAADIHFFLCPNFAAFCQQRDHLLCL